MKGLSGFIQGVVGFVVTIVILILVGLYCLIASQPNLKLLFAALAMFGVMLIFWLMTWADDRGILDFRNSLYDTLGPLFIGLALVAAVTVYVMA